jgi:uncharacterized Fe-S cluster-containing radical SAM superfamily protein
MDPYKKKLAHLGFKENLEGIKGLLVSLTKHINAINPKCPNASESFSKITGISSLFDDLKISLNHLHDNCATIYDAQEEEKEREKNGREQIQREATDSEKSN